jgi:hypothetical protein
MIDKAFEDVRRNKKVQSRGYRKGIGYVGRQARGGLKMPTK